MKPRNHKIVKLKKVTIVKLNQRPEGVEGQTWSMFTIDCTFTFLPGCSNLC